MKASEIECLQVWQLPFFCIKFKSKLNFFQSQVVLRNTHFVPINSNSWLFSLQSTEFADLGTPCHDTVSKLSLPGHWFWSDFVWFLPRFLGKLEFWAKEPLGFHWEWREKQNFEQKNPLEFHWKLGEKQNVEQKNLWDFTENEGKDRIHIFEITHF